MSKNQRSSLVDRLPPTASEQRPPGRRPASRRTEGRTERRNVMPQAITVRRTVLSARSRQAVRAMTLVVAHC